jgi:galactose mutarotase-like enzyme
MHRLYVPACAREGGPSAAPVDVLLGYDDAAAYGLDPHPSFGATVGRVANR